MKKFISDLQDKDQFQEIFLVKEKSLATDKNGREYLNLTLSDRTGDVNARVWDRVDELKGGFEEGDYLNIKGHVQLFMRRKQVVVHTVEKVSQSSINIKDFIATSVRPPEENFSELQKYVASMASEPIKHVVNWTLEQEGFKEILLKTPAAKTIHHAYIGGLLEHIVSICGLMDSIAKHYTFLNRDLLLFGAIYHDIGKVKELEVASGFRYSDEGRLVGHMVIACDWIECASRAHLDFPEELRLILKHIVLSHHGKLEYGSPKRPKIPEALVVSMIDELDSRLEVVHSFMKSEMDSGDSWTRYHGDLDRYFYLEILRAKQDK